MKILTFLGVMAAWAGWYFLSAIVALIFSGDLSTAAESARRLVARKIFIALPFVVLIGYRLYCVFLKNKQHRPPSEGGRCCLQGRTL